MSMSILIIAPSWIGDAVISQSLFKLLKKQSPHSQIDVLSSVWSKPVLNRMPEIRSVLHLPFEHGEFNLFLRYKIGTALRNNKYTQAIILPNSCKSALIPCFAKIKKRTGWIGEMRYGLLNDIRKLNKQQYPLMVQRFAALAFDRNHSVLCKDEIPIPNLVVNPKNAQSIVEKYNLNPKKVLALCPGAEFGPAKQWPAEHYAALSQFAINHGFQVWIFGSGNDHNIARKIYKSVCNKEVKILAGKTSLGESIDLMSLAKAVVSNDSGLMHVAAALNKPLIGVYGSSSPDFTPPLNQNALIAHTEIDCRPCFSRTCPKNHLKCLTDLLPSQVISLLDKILYA